MPSCCSGRWWEHRMNWDSSCLRNPSNKLPTRQAQLPVLGKGSFTGPHSWFRKGNRWIHSTCTYTLHNILTVVFLQSSQMLMGLECLVEHQIRINSQVVWEKVSCNLSHKAHKRSSLSFTYIAVMMFSLTHIWDYATQSLSFC